MRRRRALTLVVGGALVAAGALSARALRQDSAPAAVVVPEPLPAAPPAPRDVASEELAIADRLFVAGDLEGGEAALRRAVEANPESAEARYRLGRLLVENGRASAGARELRRALELDPADAEATFALGVAEDERGHERAARRHYRRAFELDPTLADPRRHPEVARQRQALAALLELWQDDAAATALARAAIAPAPATGSERGSAETSRGSGEAAARASQGGGYARVTGGERGAPRPDGSQPELDISGSGDRARSARPRSGDEAVIDSRDIQGGSFVNQIVSPGEPAGGSRRGGGAGTSKGNRGFGPRFNPAPRPFEPEFDPDEESNGRIEPLLLPADTERFAIAG